MLDIAQLVCNSVERLGGLIDTLYFAFYENLEHIKNLIGQGDKEAGEDDFTVNHWLPVREENGIVYAITDSLPGIAEYYYYEDYPVPYLQQGNECVLYNFSTDIGETLYPQQEGSTVKSYDTYQFLDGTEGCVLKTNWSRFDLYEKMGLLNDNGMTFGVMDPLSGMIIPTNGHVYVSCLNAFYQDNTMLYKAPDAPEGLCVNDTCWTRDDAEAYAVTYKADPRQEEVFAYIRQLQKGIPSGITIKDSQTASQGTLFDLQGRKLQSKPARGIYIKDGKKVLVK